VVPWRDVVGMTKVVEDGWLSRRVHFGGLEESSSTDAPSPENGSLPPHSPDIDNNIQEIVNCRLIALLRGSNMLAISTAQPC
jgi:hypothetical protein